MNTLLLDCVRWDLVCDANGDIALAANPYAIAQDVANAVRLFWASFGTTPPRACPGSSRRWATNRP